MRILCLHGGGSNNDISRMHVAHLELERYHGARCDYLQADVVVPPENPSLRQHSTGPFFSWVDPRDPTDATRVLQSLRAVEAFAETHGPYDGLFGFSMGGTLVSMLSHEFVWRGLLKRDAPLSRFALVANAGGVDMMWRGEALAEAARLEGSATPAYDTFKVRDAGSVRVPSFHVTGARDWIRYDGLRLLRVYRSATHYEHEFGHALPLRLARDARLRDSLGEILAEHA